MRVGCVLLVWVLGSMACAAPAIDDGFDRRSSVATDEDEQTSAKGKAAPSGSAASAASSSSSSSSSPAPTSSAPPAPAPAPSSTTPPAPQPSSPTGVCATSDAPSPCTALEGGSLCTGLARCLSTDGGTTGAWSACQCGLVQVDIAANNDCVTVSCPATAPNVVGCAITFTGEDGRGCVAAGPNSSSVFLKEGNQCGAGSVGGTLFCSPAPSGEPLNATTCPMNSTRKLYVTSASSCPR